MPSPDISEQVRVALSNLVEAADLCVTVLGKLAASADDCGAEVIDADAAKWRKLADDGRAALRSKNASEMQFIDPQ